MLQTEKDLRYRELLAKDKAGTLTPDEYEEIFELEQEALYEDCLRMSQLGIQEGKEMIVMIIVVFNLAGVIALIYQMHKFVETSLYYSKSADEYILKLYKVVDNNFKKEAEILNSLTEWRNSDE